jgi:hypothetical protein
MDNNTVLLLANPTEKQLSTDEMRLETTRAVGDSAKAFERVAPDAAPTLILLSLLSDLMPFGRDYVTFMSRVRRVEPGRTSITGESGHLGGPEELTAGSHRHLT